jgi:hypothetical protein
MLLTWEQTKIYAFSLAQAEKHEKICSTPHVRTGHTCGIVLTEPLGGGAYCPAQHGIGESYVVKSMA